MITPFDWKAAIDFEAVDRLLDFYLRAGVRGIFANCLSSEMYSITDTEKLALVRHIVQYLNGKVPVVATGSFGPDIEAKADFVRRMHDTGVEAVILISAHFAPAEAADEVMLKGFSQLLEQTADIPLGIYECPAPYKRILSANAFRELLKTNRLVYHKDTSITHQHVKTKLDIIQELGSPLEFFDAHTPNASFSMQHGAAGLSSISGNFYPEIMVWMVEHARNPSSQETLQWLQQELTAVDPLIHQAYPVSAKYFLQKRGLPLTTVSRVQVMDLTADQRQALDELYQRFLGWCERLQIPVVTG
ncbi:dihydrodipicolinate synthase family protein [Niabella terrae]